MIVKYLISVMVILSYAFSIAGVLVILSGGIQAFIKFVSGQLSEALSQKSVYSPIRQRFAEKIVLGLEFFVGADIIKTIAAPSFSEIGKLAAIVAIRTVLSYFLGREINGSQKSQQL